MDNPIRREKNMSNHREREEALIAKVWGKAKVNELHPGDLKEVLDAFRAAHRREDTIRDALAKIPLEFDYAPQEGSIT